MLMLKLLLMQLRISNKMIRWLLLLWIVHEVIVHKARRGCATSACISLTLVVTCAYLLLVLLIYAFCGVRAC